MINQMVMVYTNIITVHLMKDYGMMKCKMNMVLKIGMMVHVIKESTKMVRRMELDNIYGQMVLNIMVNGKIII